VSNGATRRGPPGVSGRRSPARKPPRGYSLIEIMVAMLLVALIATSLAAFNGYTARARQLSQQRAVALVAAQEAIDIIRSAPFDSVTAGTFTVVSTVGKIPLTLVTTIQVARYNLKLVNVAVKNTQGKTLQNFVTAVFKSS
jgi:prepilin-type N-terminal cleavage/methylation domain-containing protein